MLRAFGFFPVLVSVLTCAVEAAPLESVPQGRTAARPLAVPRNVRVHGKNFVLSSTGAAVVMSGPNVVVKGPPYLPSVSGSTICNDTVNGDCGKAGNCTSCETFNQADVDHIKSLGGNSIRLGVVWAGAQTADADTLDADFVGRLHDILDLTDKNGIHVILDNHGDMTSTAGCGNGAPMWLSRKAPGVNELLGKPLRTDLPYSIVTNPPFPRNLRVEDEGGYEHCGDDKHKWGQYAGDPNYNLLNECCQALNSGSNPPALGFSAINQKIMTHIVEPGSGRDDFVRYWRLLAKEVARHPSAVGCELMNEPISLHRKWYYETWRACAEAINGVIPDMAVAVSDTGEGSFIPHVLTKMGIVIDWDLGHETIDWIKSSHNLFYAWHWYGYPDAVADAVKNAQAISDEWNMPTYATEFMSCDMWNACASANISHSYWHYSSYCTTGPSFGNRKVPSETFGACILGWAAGNNAKCQ